VIRIFPSPTADTRTCDFANVSQETLLASSKQHIHDVRRGLEFFASLLRAAGERHDTDKITDIEGFHRDFVTGFKVTEWWDRHRRLNRHHLNMADGVPEDVTLIDVLDYIADCVMAGMARNGGVRPLEISPELLERAFDNTVAALKRQVVVVEPEAV
jgi:hypothetical protein